MKIRLLTATDAANYWELRLEALKQHPEAFATSYEEAIQRENPVEGVAKNLTNNNSFTFGAFDQDQLVGVVTLLLETPIKLSHRAKIVAMYVTPNMRKLGVGQKLLSAAIDHAKSINTLEQLNLSVVTSNQRAKRLYTKLGFNVFGTEHRALKVNDSYYDEDHMVLFIK